MPGLFVRLMVAPLLPLLLLAACGEPAGPAEPAARTSTSSRIATESVAVERPSPEEIVDDPESQLVEVRFVPGDRNRRVALWRRCGGTKCVSRELAVAFTDDGFRTRTVADATWRNALVRISDGGQVVVIDHRARLRIDVVRADGSVTPADMSRDRAPVAPGEVVGGVDYIRARPLFWATDSTTALAHAVTVPGNTQQLIQTDGGQLRAITTDFSYAWSDDGGATWNRHLDALDRHLMPGFVTSTDDTHVVVGGGDGATLFPFNQIRLLDGSLSVIDVPGDPTAYIGPAAVLPDGRFLATVEDWSDRVRLDQPLKGTPPGIYVSVGDDWSTYERIESGAPFASPEPMQPMVVDIEVTADGVLLTALGPDQTTAWASQDLGATWLEMRVR